MFLCYRIFFCKQFSVLNLKLNLNEFIEDKAVRPVDWHRSVWFNLKVLLSKPNKYTHLHFQVGHMCKLESHETTQMSDLYNATLLLSNSFVLFLEEKSEIMFKL